MRSLRHECSTSSRSVNIVRADRFFDIWKPFGAREAQVLPGGFGVVADEVVAGITSMIALLALLWASCGRLEWAFLQLKTALLTSNGPPESSPSQPDLVAPS